ncbi:hypothetical protein [Bradymonas sediminis]|uniref:hypothetical protein n=1 Tax=Bradymonas sediminis TaxID=1548548 RepID=UPI00105F7055|nr:hypothetical protein [Bradymonas sediminis]
MNQNLLRGGLLCLGICGAPLFLGACADAEGPLNPEDYYSQGTSTQVLEPIGFSDKKYAERGEDSIAFQGETSIADTLALITATESERTWYGFSPLDPYPLGGDRTFGDNCDPFQNPNYPEPIRKIDELPTVIEGVVTLHPRYFQKIRVCGEDQRYYGAYFLQDDTGGILILKDSRVTDFTFGQRVRLRVRGLYKSFDSYAVVTFDNEEVVDPGTKHDIYFEEATEALDFDDIGQVRRVRGTIYSEPTSTNFNAMFIRDENGVSYAASIDRELAQRNIGLKNGVSVQLTGPVVNSYGDFVVLISSLGQIERLDD